MNDDELKVVISSVLEADEDASAQRIAAQLPSISNKINQKSAIKVGVTLDTSNVNTAAQQISKELSKASQHPIGVKVELDRGAVSQFRNELSKLGVDDAVMKALSKELDSMGVRIDKVSGAWKNAVNGEEKLLNLTIQGTDALQRKVEVAKHYTYYIDQETEKLVNESTQVKRVTADLEKQRRTEESIAKQTKADNESRVAYLEKQSQILMNIQAAYTRQAKDGTGVVDQARLDELNRAAKTIQNVINTYSQQTGKLTKVEQADVESMISILKRLSSEYQNVESIRKYNAAQQEKDEERKLNYYQRELDALQKLKAQAESPKNGLKDTSNLQEVEARYKQISELLDTLKAKTGALSGEETRRVAAEIAALSRLIQAHRDEEVVAEQKAKKDVSATESRIAAISRYRSILSDLEATYTGKTGAKGISDAQHLEALNSAYRGVIEEVKRLESTTGALSQSQKASVESQIANLKRLIKEYQNTDYVATKLRTKDVSTVKADQIAKLEQFEQKLREAGVLTESFQSGIDHLRVRITSAFDAESITLFLNKFDSIQNHADTLIAKISQINNLWQRLSAVSGKVSEIQQKLIGLNPSQDAQKIAALHEELALYQAQELEIGAQIQSYGALNALAQGRIGYEQQVQILESQVAVTEAEIADQARIVDQKMAGIKTTVDALNVSFHNLTNPTQSLIDKVGTLATLMESVRNAKSDKEKVVAYETLARTIADCNEQITKLNRIQRGEIMDAKFTANLDKAKADLLTIRRTWSQFTHDKGLNQQFEILKANLARVRSQADLTKWTAQFSAFKSEVKAAGMNMQSLGDIMKNNVSKVLQWVSATTLLFRAFRMLRSAVRTVVDLDTAMIDLRKTTTATEAEYRAFYESANETAKRLNSTTEAVISQAAEWSRLGYAMQDAAKLAENSAIFAAVSPGMEQSEATDGLVSIIKAYNVDVNDTMDGIISKVNAVGNAFAVSNKDIVEALTRSSSAMAAANNTFDETVALATSAIEITRDAASVGNGLKTLSMRIRGYDEETEEYSEDVAILTGKIADLTKTASKPGGISLFEPDDAETYRSTYDILSDIADIWDELTDKNRANLLEALFGKRQAQIGSAILSNFNQARKSIDTMAKSAGSADREMEKIMASLDYKINALKETWTGVAQNLFAKEDIAGVVEVLTALSNIIDALTNKLGLFGTVTLVGLITYVRQVITSVTSLQATANTTLNSLAGITFDGSATSALRYASALEGLDATQKKLVMDMAGLSAEQQQQVLNMSAATTAVQQYTVAELESQLGMEAGLIAKQLNVTGNTMVTESLLKAALANGTLTEAQLAAIVSTNAQTGALAAQTIGLKGFTAAMKTAALSMMTNPIGWITLLIGIVPLAIQLIRKLHVSQQELYDSADELKTKYEETQKELQSLQGELDNNAKRIKELQDLSNNGTITLIEQEELERLQRANAELASTIEMRRQLAEEEAKDANQGYVKAFNKKSFNSIDIESAVTDYNALYDKNRELLEEAQRYFNGYSDWYELDEDALNAKIEEYDEVNAQLYEIEQRFNNVGVSIVDYAQHVEELVARYEELNKVEEEGAALSEEQADQRERIRRELLELGRELSDDYLAKYVGTDENTEEWNRLLDLIKKITVAVEYFTEKLAEIPDSCHDKLTELGEASALTAEKVTELANQFPELKKWMEESGYSAEDVAANFNALGRSADTNATQIKEFVTHLAELRKELADLSSHGGNVDLTNRRKVPVTNENLSTVRGWGMDDTNVGGYMTVASQTYRDGEKGKAAIVVTPILPNGELLTQDELDEYIDGLLSGTTDGNFAANDELGIILGVFDDADDWETNLANAYAFTESVHELYEEILVTLEDFGKLVHEEGAENLFPVVDVDGMASYLEYADKLKEIYDVIASAQEEMMTKGSLSAGTIKSLSKVTEDYTQYLYEENGVIKLNADALTELATKQAAMDVSKIREQTQAYMDQNQALDAERKYLEKYKESLEDLEHVYQQNFQHDVWEDEVRSVTEQIEANSRAIEANNRAIQENQQLIGQYESISSPWEDVFSVFDGYTSAMQTLADIQATVANGFTISAEKAREFAAVYPELLEAATTSADGQITLNEDIVNSFLSGKQAELENAVEAEVEKLQAEKAVLEAKKASAQAQLDLIKNVGDGEGQIAKEVAEYRINMSNALTQALIDNGVSEAEANALVAAAMSENEEEFARVAMGAFENMDENAAKAAYSMAQNILKNAQQSAKSMSGIARAAHEAAKAIAAMGEGEIAGSDAPVAITGGGVRDGGVSLDLYKGDFKGAEVDYEAAKVSLEDYAAQLELDISKYTEAIGEIDAQIALLRSIGTKTIGDFVADRSGSHGGKSGGSSGTDKAAKEVEEYIATLDDYREALKRLSEARATVAQIEQKYDNSDNLNEQILLQRELIDAYAEQQAALHNLNNQRDSTIHAGVNALRELGFAVTYNDETNQLWIENMEHLNELTAESQGEYETLQEATNALRQETEDLIESVTDLNEENQEASAEWWDLKYATEAAKDEIHDLLRQIVENASKAVDAIQDVYDTLHKAADEYAQSGYITIDTLQGVIALGEEYVAYLRDESGHLVINEERIRDVIAAKTQQLAIESSLSYIESLRIALEEKDVSTLNRLLTATEDATDATWGLVYANLQLLDLSEDQYSAALSNINAIRALADNAIQHIGDVSSSVTDTLNEMKSGLDDILKYVMDMLKQRVQDQIDALEDMKDAYSEIINQKKESLKADKEAVSYQKTIASKLKEMAQLQAKIDALSLDDSRESQAERSKLLEELSDLQEELADTQSDHMVDAQQEALDKMEDDYHKEKDTEIEVLEDTISSYQKLYDMAIEYISNHWDTLYNELIDWNTEYGSVLNSEITSAWENCLAAAQRYGDYVSALSSIDADIAASQSEGQNTTVGQTYYSEKASDTDMVKAIVERMKGYSRQWSQSNTEALNNSLHEKAALEAAKLDQFGVHASYDSASGVWTITDDKLTPGNVGKYLYQCYHSGGVVGGDSASTLKQDEVFAKLQKGEMVLTEAMVDTLSRQIDQIQAMQKAFADVPDYMSRPSQPDILKPVSSSTFNNVTNNSQPVINIGDTNIYGATQETVEKHKKVTDDFAEQIFGTLNIKRSLYH